MGKWPNYKLRRRKEEPFTKSRLYECVQVSFDNKVESIIVLQEAHAELPTLLE